MSTYLPGFQAYIPQIQPFTPDYNFYNGVLGQKQGKYDAAKKQLSTMYGSLLNAPLTREDNVESRDKFFKTIDQDIKKMATMDLSLAQNSDAAMGVFNQITENKNLVHDMVWTKQFQGNYQKGQYLKSCPDPEKCGGSWWEGGDRLMQYGQQEYKNASADEAMNMSAPSYVSHQNVMTKAMKIADEMDLNITQDVVKGGYIVTTKNGALAEPHMQNLLFGSLGNDPLVAEYYKASAQLGRKDFLYSNQEQYGSLESAEQAYIQTILGQNVAQEQEVLEKTVTEKAEGTKQKIKQLEEKQKNSLPDERSDIQKMLDDLQSSVIGYEASAEKVKEVTHQNKIAQTQQTMTGRDIDNLVAAKSLQSDLVSAANTLAYKNYEQTLAVDQYSLEAVKQSNRMTAMSAQHLLNKDFALFEHELKQKLENTTLHGSAQHNIPVTIEEGVLGGTAKGLEDDDKRLERGFEQYSEIVTTTEADISGNEKLILQGVLDRSQAEAEKGNVQAQEDFVTLIANIASAKNASQGNIGLDPEATIREVRGGEGAAGSWFGEVQSDILSEQLTGNKPMSEKYALAKKYAAENNLDAVDGNQVDLVYDAIMPGLTSLKDGNQYSRDYLAPLWLNENVLGARRNIEAKDAHLKQMKTWYKSKAKEAAAGVRADENYTLSGIVNPELTQEETDYFNNSASEIPNTTVADGIESYLDDNGHVNTEEAFIKNMMQKGHSKVLAENMWGGTQVDPHMGHYISSWGNGFGTTLVGGFEFIMDNTFGRAAQAVGGIVNVFGGDVDWAPDEFEHGFNYEGATAHANYWANDVGAETGFGGKSIHTLYKQAISQYAKPDGDMAFTGVTGAGDVTSKAQTYRSVDPSAGNSVGAMAMKGIFEDATRSSSRFDLGGFQVEKPEENVEAAQAAFNLYQSDFYNLSVKDKNRPITQMTYSDVAASDPNTMGVNIKFNQGWLNKYKPTANNPGIFGESYADLAANGITIYMDRDGAQNIATSAASKTSLEHLMNLTGEINMDPAGGGYTDGFKISSEGNGTYKAAGYVQSGVDENGKKEWEYFQTIHPGNVDVNDLTKQIDGILHQVRNLNDANKTLWLKNQMQNI